MTMQMTQQSHNMGEIFGWFNYERRNWVAIVGMAFALGFWVGNGHTTQNAIHDVSQQAACEHVRADKTAILTKQAIKGALSADAPIPSPNAIPKDNCPHAVAP